MNRKINIFAIFLVIIVILFLHIQIVQADDDLLWCYYKDNNSMIRVSLNKTLVNDKKKYNAYIDLYKNQIMIGTTSYNIVENYIKNRELWTSPSYSSDVPPTLVYDFKCYKCDENGRIDFGNAQAVCPQGILYTIENESISAVGGKGQFFVYNKEEYETIASAFAEVNQVLTYTGNATLIDDHKDYWTAYQESFEQYIGEEIKLQGCDVIDEDVKKLINKILTYIAILVPIGVIGISIYELAKSLGQGKEDEMKKAQKHLIIRIVVSLLIFLVPTIVNFLFNVVNGLWSESELYTCDIYGESIGDNSACYYCHNLPDGKRFVWGFTNILNEAHTCHETSYTDVDNCLNQNNNN